MIPGDSVKLDGLGAIFVKRAGPHSLLVWPDGEDPVVVEESEVEQEAN